MIYCRKMCNMIVQLIDRLSSKFPDCKIELTNNDNEYKIITISKSNTTICDLWIWDNIVIIIQHYKDDVTGRIDLYDPDSINNVISTIEDIKVIADLQLEETYQLRRAEELI